MATLTRKAKTTKATDAEKREYAASNYGDTAPLYPLSHWVTVDGRICPVERIGSGRDGEAAYEIILPHGYHDKHDQIHSAICIDIADVAVRAAEIALEACGTC